VLWFWAKVTPLFGLLTRNLTKFQPTFQHSKIGRARKSATTKSSAIYQTKD